MTARLRALVATAAAATALACTACGQAPPPEASASLNGAVARVGSVALPPSLVADVARAKGSSPRAAVEDLVRDALVAQGSLARGLGRAPSVSWQSAAALARRVPDHLFDAAAAEGPPTDDELAVVSVVHAVVMRSATLREPDALALAGAIRQAVVGVHTADDFVARANAVAHPHVQVIAQPVGPFAADGRDAGGGELDAGFVAASFALRAPFETSPIVTTPFGWHVIQLVERKASPVADGPPADRAQLLGPSIVRMRARTQLDELLRARSAGARVEISSAADALMAQATTAQSQ